MISGLAKIIKDETRQKILLVLQDKEALSYTELMELSGMESTGLFNYHLKVMGDLLCKNNDGQYLLTDKGKVASKLLDVFPIQESQQQQNNRRSKFWAISATAQILYLIAVVLFFFLHYIDSSQLSLNFMWIVGSLALTFLGYKWQGRAQRGDFAEREFRAGYVAGGGLVGFVFAFFGTPLVSYLAVSFGGPSFMGLIDFYVTEYVSLLVVASILGGLAGYVFGKRVSFRQPKWAKWLDNNF